MTLYRHKKRAKILLFFELCKYFSRFFAFLCILRHFALFFDTPSKIFPHPLKSQINALYEGMHIFDHK